MFARIGLAVLLSFPAVAVAGPDLGGAVNAMMMMLICWIPIVALIVFATGRWLLPSELRTGSFFYLSLLASGIGGPLIAKLVPAALIGKSTIAAIMAASLGAALISFAIFSAAKYLR